MRYKMLIEYDGTGFSGWQKQQGQSSVQETLEKALTVALRTPTELAVCGRTDTGVHALGQVAHFDGADDLDCRRLTASVNALVRPDLVVVKQIEAVDDSFHARFSAKQRTYLYKIQNTPYPPVLRKNKVAHISLPLDETLMDQTAQILVGKHDFSTFRASGCQAKSPIKTLDSIHVWREKEMVFIQVQARSFLYHQVRNMVGSLILVGIHKWSPSQFEQAFLSCDRTQAGPTAPACGLYFKEVVYK